MPSESIPEIAITTFERLNKLQVTVHDLRGTLWPYLSPERFQHSQPRCQAVKVAGFETTCFAFDGAQMRRELPLRPEGTIKICHAGFVEWAVPVFRGEELEWVLFAGIRRAEINFRDTIRQQPSKAFYNLDLVPVDEEESAIILESLRQLAARLWMWEQENTRGENTNRHALPSNEMAVRRTIIMRFIAAQHTKRVRLSDLAQRLNLSESRTGHLVRECCDLTFRELLNQARLRTAMGLLRHSELGVVEVAMRSGFEDVRQFHRQFLRETGTTPGRYRATARS